MSGQLYFEETACCKHKIGKKKAKSFVPYQIKITLKTSKSQMLCLFLQYLVLLLSRIFKVFYLHFVSFDALYLYKLINIEVSCEVSTRNKRSCCRRIGIFKGYTFKIIMQFRKRTVNQNINKCTSRQPNQNQN